MANNNIVTSTLSQHMRIIAKGNILRFSMIVMLKTVEPTSSTCSECNPACLFVFFQDGVYANFVLKKNIQTALNSCRIYIKRTISPYMTDLPVAMLSAEYPSRVYTGLKEGLVYEKPITSSGWKFDSVQDHDPNLPAFARCETVIRPVSDITFITFHRGQ